MNEQRKVEELKKEGFDNVYIWRDNPGVTYPDHKHHHISAHVVLEGELIIKIKGKEYIFKSGDRSEVPKGQTHSAKIGSKGCKYIIAEKY